MGTSRRQLIAGTAAMVALGTSAMGGSTGRNGMFGLIGRMRATPGNRDSLIDLLLAGTGEMPGCLSYIVATDPADADAIWITEVWDSRESHKASLSLPAVQAAISSARPMIAGFDSSTEVAPVGGVGLPTAAQ